MQKKSINDKKPLISVITPAFNSAKFIGETIESVLAQTYSNWEMIITDDCSEDDTVKIIEEYQKADARIKLVKLKQNSGAACARNTAIDIAGGRYLAFLDSDDLWLPEKLEVQLDFMQEKQIAFSFTKYMNITENGIEGSIIKIPNQVNYKQLLKQNVIGCLTVMLDREMLQDIHMLNIRARQDYVLWLSLLKQGHTGYGIQKVLSKYRIVQNSLSRNKVKMAKQNWKVYREIEEINLFKSLWYFSHYAYFKFNKYKRRSK